MSLDKIKKMLMDLSFYGECEITHTFSRERKPIFTVSGLKQEKCAYRFQIKYTETQNIEIYDDVESAAMAIYKMTNAKNSSPDLELTLL